MLWRCVRRVRSARKFLFNVIVSASVFAAAPVGAQDTTGQVRALRGALDKLKPGGAEPNEKLNREELFQLASTISRVLDPTVAATAWATDLTVLLADKKLKSSHENLRGALLVLNDVISKSLGASPAATPATEVTNAQIKELTEILVRLRPVENEPIERFEPVELTRLATAIARVLDPTEGAVAWATDLTFVLTERSPKRADEGLRRALIPITALAEATIRAADPGPQYLNIVQAWFGDLHYVRRAASGQLRINPVTGTGLRVCDATNEVRSVCQAKTACTFGLDATTPSPAQLCGEHPAPHGSKDVVGVGIEFQCLSGPEIDWNALQNDWKVAAGPPPKMMMLRAGTSVTIRCAADHTDVEAGQPPK